jgi:ParB family transcriptional regulator, chromosome partitioning protein
MAVPSSRQARQHGLQLQARMAGYLGRVSKTLICEAVTQAKGKAAADNIAALKKGDMADHAARLLAGTGWLPAMLRAA